MAITYPENCTAAKDKMEFLISLREKNRLLYNLMSKWADTGLSEAEYANIPATLTGAKSYISNLSVDSFKTIIFGKWEPVDREIHLEMGIMKGLLMKSTAWSPDLEEHAYGV